LARNRDPRSINHAPYRRNLDRFQERERGSRNIIEAAQRLKVSKSYVWKLIAEGPLRATRIGRRTVIRESAIVALLDGADAAAE
jgi:excisionase family DNA binding protein